MKISTGLIGGLLCLSASVGWAQYDVIVVAGQSNAVGVGASVFSDPLASAATDARIVQLGRCTPATNGKIIPAVEPLDHWGCEGSLQKRGFALPVARRYVRSGLLAKDRKVLILPAAKSGLKMKYWNPQGGLECEKGAGVNCYQDMIARLKGILQDPKNRLVAVHWQHAEADMRIAFDAYQKNRSTRQVKAAAELYQKELIAFVNSLRKAVPASSRSAPFIIGEPARNVIHGQLDSPYYLYSFTEALKNAAKILACAEFVTSGGLSVNSSPRMVGSDRVHFTGDGQRVMAERRHQAFIAQAACLK